MTHKPRLHVKTADNCNNSHCTAGTKKVSQFEFLFLFLHVFSLYALLSKKHAKVMELIKQTEGGTSANTQEGQHNDHVSGIQFTTMLTLLIGAQD